MNQDLNGYISLPEGEKPEVPGDTDSDNTDAEGAEGGEAVEKDDDDPTKCLFCENIYPNVPTAIDHVGSEHGLAFDKLRTKFNMDQYSYIKLINYIRRNKVKAEDIIKAETELWHNDEYMKSNEYEPWLSYDFEDYPLEPGQERKPTAEQQMKGLINELRQKAYEQEEFAEYAKDSITKMRRAYRRLFEKTDPQSWTTPITGRPDGEYFNSYSHYEIHYEMLSDAVRTLSYKDAIMNNRRNFKGKTVIDVGCGTAVLSIFASQAGAKEIFAVDNADIIYKAINIAKENKVDNIKFIKGRVEIIQIPVEKVDIIISEWMGYFLLFESMLDSVIHVRDRHLKKGGVMMPNKCAMYIMGYGDEKLYKKRIHFWNSVHGLDMSSMKSEVLHEPLIDAANPKYVLTEPYTLLELDLYKVDTNYSNYSTNFKLKCNKKGRLSAFVGYFDAFFNSLPNSVTLSTSPFGQSTHWKQVIFFLDEAVEIQEGDIIRGSLQSQRSNKNQRSLDIVIKVFNKEFTYYID